MEQPEARGVDDSGETAEQRSSTHSTEQRSSHHSTRGAWIRIAGIAAFVIVAAVIAWRLGFFSLKGDKLRHLAQRARSTPWVAPLFVVIYAAVIMVGLPPTPGSLLGGAVFGFLRGLLYNWLGMMIGAAAAYWVARGMGGGHVRHLLEKHENVMKEMREANGFLPILRMQIVPMIPLLVANYAAGSIGLPFFPFLGATAIGVLPGTAMYTYVASQVVGGDKGATHRALLWTAVVGVAALLLTFAPRIIRKMRGRDEDHPNERGDISRSL